MKVSRILRGLDPTRESSFVRRVRRYLSPVLFWSAIVLPLLYLPLVATGLDSINQVITLLALLSLHVVALLAGHSYSPG